MLLSVKISCWYWCQLIASFLQSDVFHFRILWFPISQMVKRGERFCNKTFKEEIENKIYLESNNIILASFLVQRDKLPAASEKPEHVQDFISQRFQEILTDLVLRQNFLLPALMDKILTHTDSSVHFEYVLTEVVWLSEQHTLQVYTLGMSLTAQSKTLASCLTSQGIYKRKT